MSSIPLADARRLRPLARRTAWERASLAGFLVLIVLGVAALARRPQVEELRFVPAGASGLVVLDVSASISSDTYERIGNTLAELASTQRRYGLVLFSDVAYEALPPGTPAAELRPLVRLFTVPKQTSPGFAPEFPPNPWTDAFSSGTRISTGLELAQSIIRRDRLTRPAVLLVSDLDDDPTDLPRLRRLSLDLQRSGVTFGIVSLNASPEDERFFRRVLPEPGALVQSRLPGEPAPEVSRASSAWPLVGAVVAFALALAANELRLARLTWAGRRA